MNTMMTIYTSFVDTSAFYALEDSDDKHHDEAIETREAIKKGALSIRKLYTSNFIFDETLTLLRMNLGHAHAVDFGGRLKSSKIVEIVRIDEGLEEEAWKIFKTYKDKRYSFTDCSSFALMDEMGIDRAFSFDENFEQYGFSMISV